MDCVGLAVGGHALDVGPDSAAAVVVAAVAVVDGALEAVAELVVVAVAEWVNAHAGDETLARGYPWACGY